MPKHKGEDYKISAVQYFLEHNASYIDTCRIFKCSVRILKRWINRYQNEIVKQKYKNQIVSKRFDLNQQKKININILTYQECSATHEILIRIAKSAGHGACKPTKKKIEEVSEKWAFMFYEMGVGF